MSGRKENMFGIFGMISKLKGCFGKRSTEIDEKE